MCAGFWLFQFDIAIYLYIFNLNSMCNVWTSCVICTQPRCAFWRKLATLIFGWEFIWKHIYRQSNHACTEYEEASVNLESSQTHTHTQMIFSFFFVFACWSVCFICKERSHLMQKMCTKKVTLRFDYVNRRLCQVRSCPIRLYYVYLIRLAWDALVKRTMLHCG